ncbi:MAG: diaminopimelate decarboxylase [Negativicutes bacterium]|nr:diaminopimelate decarboxylase [Negativicutes bacterium]
MPPFAAAVWRELAEKYGTPLYVYDRAGIIRSLTGLQQAFAWVPGYKEYFAVKANPNPQILRLLADNGAGADCASLAELILAERVGLKGEEIIFTSNQTPDQEFVKACELGAIINLDDISHIEVVEGLCGLPELLSFRYNPGEARSVGNSIIGLPAEAKYGMTRDQLLTAVGICRKKGVRRFALHTMVVSNELNGQCFVDTARMMFELAVEIYRCWQIKVEMINLGGGVGIPYLPQQQPVDLPAVGGAIRRLYDHLLVANRLTGIRLSHECGRLITGPHGYLLTRAIRHKNTYKNYIGVDACMANLMRPGMYGAYHHITVVGKEGLPYGQKYDVVGSLCENNDKFAIDRPLPAIDAGDLLVIHDAGAHGYAMGFNYNGRLRCPEVMVGEQGESWMIRRGETLDDYFATMIW